ncbi:hypothetical protein GPL17_36935 [Bradyrhizobium yuanmingense]|uniref:hypothetical protein n=1 Tax=Bradyrhizobium yuanmingense TaxID=108015 RepID=UPI0012FB3120|nr:hypothetical protein [Bradyrhizobium yuanmingense]MVT55965.1 hypothetical protein [Bradyrhizobium yuanmingense]
MSVIIPAVKDGLIAPRAGASATIHNGEDAAFVRSAAEFFNSSSCDSQLVVRRVKTVQLGMMLHRRRLYALIRPHDPNSGLRETFGPARSSAKWSHRRRAAEFRKFLDEFNAAVLLRDAQGSMIPNWLANGCDGTSRFNRSSASFAR